MVIDHTNFAVLHTEADHTLIASSDFVESDIILGNAKIEAPVLFKSIGRSVNPSNSLALKLLSASPSAYSANPNSKLTSPPSLLGSAILLVSVMQDPRESSRDSIMSLSDVGLGIQLATMTAASISPDQMSAS
ncbi:Dolichyl-diphosphooligosaccharide--protein glycosyltransferase 48 kDa subunit [Euphorbia peplus]|nr:Dolichyl-diphosphooligosaccharide--protein glycosyltransferase 48 kDa subunit [Euphorbia peplus]